MAETISHPTIDEQTELGIGILVAESEDGRYQPVSPVSTINEARDIAASDLRARMEDLERGESPFCPARYLVWARISSGGYSTVAEIESN